MNHQPTLLPYAIYMGEELTHLFAIKPSEYQKDFKKGKLQGKRFGRKYRFAGKHLKVYLAEQCGIQVSFQEEIPTRQGVASSLLEQAQQARARTNQTLMIRLRWKILLRDNFTCQYCGGKAPQGYS